MQSRGFHVQPLKYFILLMNLFYRWPDFSNAAVKGE